MLEPDNTDSTTENTGENAATESPAAEVAESTDAAVPPKKKPAKKAAAKKAPAKKAAAKRAPKKAAAAAPVSDQPEQSGNTTAAHFESVSKDSSPPSQESIKERTQ